MDNRSLTTRDKRKLYAALNKKGRSELFFGPYSWVQSELDKLEYVNDDTWKTIADNMINNPKIQKYLQDRIDRMEEKERSKYWGPECVGYYHMC